MQTEQLRARKSRVGSLRVRRRFANIGEPTGYVVLAGFFSPDSLDKAWIAYKRSIAGGVIVPQVDRG
jgi:hypothetical protein